MKLAVVGSRKYPRLDLVSDFFRKGLAGRQKYPHIITGDADGVDACAIESARIWGMPCTSIPYPKHRGRRGGPERNYEIAQQSDGMVAFWDGESRGTCWAVKFAREKGITVVVYAPDGAKVHPALLVAHLSE